MYTSVTTAGAKGQAGQFESNKGSQAKLKKEG
jgi:hypothetical protein